MAEKVTIMELKVDLQCPCCYKKIKKILCKFPQIRDQVYDEKGNTVAVTVVCCSPEKIRDKLCSKGGKVIKSIEIKEPEKKKEPGKKKEAEKPKEPEKPKVVVVEKPKEPEKPKVVVVEPEKPKPDGGKPQDKPKEAPKPAAKPLPPTEPVNGIPPVFPVMACYGPSHGGFGGGAPWYNGYGVPPPPQPRYDGYYGYEYGYPNQYGSRSYNSSSMGNCVSAGSTLSRKKLHPSPKTTCSGDSPLPEEIQNLIPQLMQLNGLQLKPGSTEDCSGKRIKIVATREQLLVLLRNAPELESLLRKVKKWRPCLDTIPEIR